MVQTYKKIYVIYGKNIVKETRVSEMVCKI